jgi:hypothetical protein
MWTQWWVSVGADEDAARAKVVSALRRWKPTEAGEPTVGAVRILTGPDEAQFTEAYLQEVEEIRDLVAKTPRETLARRFAYLRHRALGIPPRPGWVVLGEGGPRSPRPADWIRGGVPRWVVEVQWPGDPPQLERPDQEG